MSYEVRINGQTVAHCATTDEALARVREELKLRPDHEPEILDSSTGQPFAPHPVATGVISWQVR